MSKKDISVLATRILALYAFILTVSSFSTLSFSLLGNYQTADGLGINRNGVIIASVLHTGVLLLLTVILWVFSKQIGRLMSSGLQDTMDNEKISATDIHAVLLSVMGLFVALSAFPHVFNMILSVVAPQTLQPPLSLIDIAPYSIQLTIGLFLAFKSSRVVNLLRNK